MKRNVTLFAVIICALLLTTLSHAADLGLTPKQFKNQFNTFLNEKSLSEFKINKIEIDQEVFTVNFHDHISMSGSIAKLTGNINGLTLIVTGNQKTITDALILYGGCMKVLHPSLSKSGRGQIIKTLLTDLPTKGKNSKISGNIKYSSTFSSLLGLWLSMESIT